MTAWVPTFTAPATEFAVEDEQRLARMRDGVDLVRHRADALADLVGVDPQPSGTTRTTAPTPAETEMSTTSCGQIACWKSAFTVDIPALRFRYAGTVQIPRRT